MKWPPANNKEAWQSFDTDICGILQTARQGSVEYQLKFMTTMIISIASERFGYIDNKQATKPYINNCRARKIKELRKELNLKKTYRKTKGIVECQPFEELRVILREKLKTVRHAE